MAKEKRKNSTRKDNDTPHKLPFSFLASLEPFPNKTTGGSGAAPIGLLLPPPCSPPGSRLGG